MAPVDLGGGLMIPDDDFGNKGGSRGGTPPGQTGPGSGGGAFGGGGFYNPFSSPYAGGAIPDALRKRLLGHFGGPSQYASIASGASQNPYAGLQVGGPSSFGQASSYSGFQGGADPGGGASQMGSAEPGSREDPTQEYIPPLDDPAWNAIYNDKNKRKNAAQRDPRFAKWAAAKQGGNSLASQTFDPNNPWGSFSGDIRADAAGASNRLIGAYGNFGAFDPGLSHGMQQAIMQFYAPQAGDRYAANQAALKAGPGGNDPSLFAYNSLQSNLGTQDALSRALGSAQYDQLNQKQQFGQGLLQSMFGGYSQEQMARLMAGLQRQNTKAEQQGNPLGGLLGPIAGAGVSALINGGGGQQKGGGSPLTYWDPNNPWAGGT